MLIFDLFSGTGSSTQAFADAGHTVIRIELDEQFEAEERDVLAMTAEYLVFKYGKPDFVWASPPCTAFSVASMGHHWGGGLRAYKPKTEMARFSQELVAHTLKLISDLAPSKGWLMENPRGMLRKLPVVEGYPRRTVTYCTYGDYRMKPTDLWGG
jgi:site-specific DNA-cytosine methylase